MCICWRGWCTIAELSVRVLWFQCYIPRHAVDLTKCQSTKQKVNASSSHPSFRPYRRNVKNCQLFPTRSPIIPPHCSAPPTPRLTQLKGGESANPSMLRWFPISFLYASEPLHSYERLPLTPKGEWQPLIKQLSLPSFMWHLSPDWIQLTYL